MKAQQPEAPRVPTPKCDPPQLRRRSEVGPAAVLLAEAEGLQPHGRSVALRLNRSRKT